jgi:hypothetical protein
VSAGLAAAVAEISPEATQTTVYFRQVYIPSDAGQQPDPVFVKPYAGRWGTAWTLHTATNPETTWAEYCRNSAGDVNRADPTGGVGINDGNLPLFGPQELGEPLPRRSLFTLTFRFEKLADLTTRSARAILSSAGFDGDEFFADDYGRCPQLADYGVRAGWEALMAPSAAFRPFGGCVAVFDAGRARLRRQLQLLASARPTVAVAVATTYASGSRPSWLG